MKMKKHLVVLLFLAIGLLLVCSPAIAAVGDPGTGITGTAHDLSSATGRGAAWDAGTAADPLDRICIYCHAPHGAATEAQATAAGVDYFPLWNHNFSTITTYTPYTNTISSAPVVPNSVQHQLNAALGQPGGVSKLCLSCHDGSQAISSYGNFNPCNSSKHTGTVMADCRIGVGVGGDLTNHHPIGFDYIAVSIADDEIKDVSNALLGLNPYGLTIGDLLWGDRMECASCHDVHNTKNTGQKFLWVEDTNSQLCFSCHKK